MSEAERRPPGRPRSAEAHEAILRAALESFLEDGYQGMSIEGVAARAGVGKTTIYRRWPSKNELIAAAVGRLTEQLGVPDTGSLRGDLIELVTRMRASQLTGQTFARLIAELSANAALGPVYLANVITPRRQALTEVLRRAVARGDMRADLDFDLALDVIAGPVILRGLLEVVDPGRKRVSAERLVDALLCGLAPR